ncbi:MAG: cation:proton antiporter [Acidimicrobiia bacterium]|nr:cation:proton antiporter [Acidimicrobiia bacterium]
MDDPTAAIATVVAVGVVAQWVATKLKIPSILLLLGAGLAAGPGLDVIDPDALLGDLLFPVVSMGVALLLFEGGLGLHRSELGSWSGVLVRLLTVGVAITGVVAAIAAATVGGLSLETAVVFGAIMTVTGPTVIIPLLRQTRLRPRVARVLRWEGIAIGAVGATLAIVVLEAVVLAGEGPVVIAREVLLTAVVGSGIGLATAMALAWALGHRLVPDHIQNAVIIAAVLVAFALANHWREEGGLFAATVLGIALANQRRAPVRHVVEFQENLGVLLIGSIFVLLGARVEAQDLRANLVPALAVLAVLVFVARPLSVAASTWRSSLTRQERLYIAGVAPRGIVAASVSALFALKLEAAGVQGSTDLAALTFVVVAGTVVVYGLGAGPLSRRLRLKVPDPTGVALIGAPPWAVELGRLLQRVEVSVLVVSTDEEEIRQAQQADLLVYNGRLAHRDLAETVEAMGVRLALAVSHREELRAFGAERFVHLLGRANVYEMPRNAEERAQSHGGAGGHEVRELGVGLTSADVIAMVAAGATTELVSRVELETRGEGFFPLLTASNGRASVVAGPVDGSAEWVIGVRAAAGTVLREPVDAASDAQEGRPPTTVPPEPGDEPGYFSNELE